MQRQTFDSSLRTYRRITVIHLPRYPLPRRGLPLYCLGEFGGRLDSLDAVHRTGVERCFAIPVRAIPVWHLRQLRQKFTTYYRGKKTAYIVDGPGEERRLADLLAIERREARKMVKPEPKKDPRIQLQEGEWTREEKELLREMMEADG